MLLDLGWLGCPLTVLWIVGIINALNLIDGLDGLAAGQRDLSDPDAERADAAGGTVVGEHDGYTRLAAPVVHRRTLRLDGRRRELLVRDELRGSGRHELLFCLHLAEHCRLTRRARNVYEIEVGCGTVELRLDPRLTVAALHGSLQPRAGWVSRGYHRKTPATTLLGRAEFDANQSLECRIAVSRPRGAQGESV